MKIVIDTNVLLSGIFWKGPPEKIVRLWDKGRFELLISAPVFAEYQEVELAIAGNAEYLVSGDKHLLKVGKYEGGEVVTPSSFVSLLS